MQGLKGVSSVAYTSGDPVALAKALSTWVKENAEFTFKLGIVDGKVITVEEIKALATMPGKEELFSKLLFLIQSPAQRLATVINAAGRDLAVVINQAVEKGKFAGCRRLPPRQAAVARLPKRCAVAEAAVRPRSSLQPKLIAAESQHRRRSRPKQLQPETAAADANRRKAEAAHKVWPHPLGALADCWSGHPLRATETRWRRQPKPQFSFGMETQIAAQRVLN